MDVPAPRAGAALLRSSSRGSLANAVLLRVAVAAGLPRAVAQVAVVAPVTLLTFALSRAWAFAEDVPSHSSPVSDAGRARRRRRRAAAGADDPADPPQRASAAMDCRPAPGNRFLDSALLHIPPHARAPLPLVLAFHGAGGNGTGFAEYSGLSKTADAHGFAVLYPNAAAHQFWSLNRAMAPRDVERLRALLPKRWRPRARIRCACSPPACPTAAASRRGSAASWRDDRGGRAGRRRLPRARPVPGGQRTSVLEIHGTADDVVPYNGKPPDRAGAVPRFLAGWARRDGCDGPPDPHPPSAA